MDKRAAEILNRAHEGGTLDEDDPGAMLRTTIPMSRWTDISGEKFRQYRFPGKELLRIEHPRYLLIDEDGGHRIFDGQLSHYVPAGWIHLHWEARDGHAHFD